MSNNNVIAGIVLYNSDYGRLLRCVEKLMNQVDKIYLLDNSPKSLSPEKIINLETNYNCEYIYTGNNLGMPEGMNRIMEIAEKTNIPWVLTMNADSIVPDSIIATYKKYFENDRIGMICPQVIDKRRKYMHIDANNRDEYVSMCITSAACTRVEAWRQVGKFDNWLFIDLLDNDISKRMILNGWKILKVNSVVLDQEFGEISAKPKLVERFWLSVGKVLHNDNIAKLSYKKNVSSIRVFYTCRNILYLNKKFKYYGGIGYKDNYNCNTFGGFLICFVIPSIMRADKKLEVIEAVKKGFEEGNKKAKKSIPWEASPID